MEKIPEIRPMDDIISQMTGISMWRKRVLRSEYFNKYNKLDLSAKEFQTKCDRVYLLLVITSN